MRTNIRRSFAGAFIAILLSVAALATTTSAQACPVITVRNMTLCTVDLCLYDAAMVVHCFRIPGGGGPINIVLPQGFMPFGVVSNGGNFYPFNVPPGGVGCTPCIELPTPGVPVPCCGIVCYDPNICEIHIHPCGAPPNCLP